MEIKKSNKANLEKNIGLFFQIGLLLSLSLILFAFDWTTKPKATENRRLNIETSYEVEEIIITPRVNPKTEPLPQQKIAEIIHLVDNDVNIDEPFDFNVEADQNTKFNNFIFIDNEEKFSDEEIFIAVDDMPLFNGGDPTVEFRKYIRENLKYPALAAENGISGKVIVQFVVNAKGKVSDVIVLGPVDPSLDKEALRVILSSPLWTPGKQGGKPVKVIYHFPINFVLQN